MNLPDLGVGIVYSPGLEPLLKSSEDLVTAIEIEPQTAWRYSPTQKQPYSTDPEIVDRLRSLPQHKLVHGVGFPVGGTQPPDRRHLPPLVEMIRGLEAPWTSEHLGFNRAVGPQGAFNTGFLLPPLQTPAGVETAAASIREVARAVPVPLAIETGVSYLQPRPGEMSDGAFTAAVAKAADCGILLDIHNLWANERNGRQPVEEFVSEIPLDRVWEVHIAGGIEYHEYWLDAHSGAIPEPVITLAARVIPQLPNLRAIIFEILPTFISRLGLDGVHAELKKVRELWDQRTQGSVVVSGAYSTKSEVAPSVPGDRSESPFVWENTLGALVVEQKAEGPLATELSSDQGIGILRKLVWDFRAGVLADTLKLTCRLLLLHGGETFTRDLMNEFFNISTPELFGSAEAQTFATFLEEGDYDVPYLREVLSFERAAIRALIEGEAQVVSFRYEPGALLGALAQGRLPRATVEGDFEVEITPEADLDKSTLGPLLGSL